jgi:hypothetical protein
VDELEEKADTVLVSRSPVSPAEASAVTCAVDGCLEQGAVYCQVRLVHMRLHPDRDTHRLPLCARHDAGFPTLKWQWRRTPDASSARLTLEGVFAPDEIEDT